MPDNDTTPGGTFTYRMPAVEADYPAQIAAALSARAGGLPVTRGVAVALAVREAHARYCGTPAKPRSRKPTAPKDDSDLPQVPVEPVQDPRVARLLAAQKGAQS